MAKFTLKPASYQKLVKFGTSNGGLHLIPTVIGTADETVVTAYLNEMRAKDPALYKKWGSRYKPETEEEDDSDPTAGMEDDDSDPTAGMDDPTVEDEDEPPAPPPPSARSGKVMNTVDGKGNGINLVPGFSSPIPEKFRLRGADGINTDLEIFSKSPKFGYLLQVPVPRDLRTIHIGGKPVEVDLLALRRDPDATTVIGDRKVANSKLIAAAELED